ncbi:DUF167 domain-containing protein [Methanoculleus sp.]|uniref:DUF167 domain-containing protein n=1 Tax=Methanoculleus sp. TaxID=90427 RepID=UPI0026229C6D|nr:DUF167 domain-containing protein [Methanoculleus sp.]MDI6867539.1 DUF167 domain-containing protein [Methanoculleus sp.]
METYVDAISETPHGVTLALDVTTGAKRSLFPAGYNEWRQSIRCHVAAPAIGGRANRAIIDLLAKTFEVPRGNVTIVAGYASSSKVVSIAGLSRSRALECLKRSNT